MRIKVIKRILTMNNDAGLWSHETKNFTNHESFIFHQSFVSPRMAAKSIEPKKAFLPTEKSDRRSAFEAEQKNVFWA